MKVINRSELDKNCEVTTSDVTETTAKVLWEEALDNVATVGYNVYISGAKVNETLVTVGGDVQHEKREL